MLSSCKGGKKYDPGQAVALAWSDVLQILLRFSVRIHESSLAYRFRENAILE